VCGCLYIWFWGLKILLSYTLALALELDINRIWKGFSLELRYFKFTLSTLIKLNFIEVSIISYIIFNLIPYQRQLKKFIFLNMLSIFFIYALKSLQIKFLKFKLKLVYVFECIFPFILKIVFVLRYNNINCCIKIEIKLM